MVNFTYTFTPGPNEAGTYSLWAVHPDITTRPVQSTFTIGGLQIEPEIANIRIVKNRTMDIPVKLTNIGETSLTNLQFRTETSPGITAGAIVPTQSGPVPTQSGGEGEVTYYLYADEGLIGEYDSSGNLKKAYGWIPDSIWGTNPVFMLENGNYYFYQNDHLGTPQKLSDVNGNIVWNAIYTAFGEAIVGPSSTVTNSLRFPGQYYDEETGKHYNWNRYYDPITGRYTQVDPIEFASGDLNLFRYVFNNSPNLTDPSGQIVPLALIGAGAAVGAIIGGSIYAITTSNFTWGGLAGSIAAGAIAGGVGVVAPAIAGSLGLGSGILGTAIVNSTAGVVAAGASAALDPCQSFTPGYAVSSAAFGSGGGMFAQWRFPTTGMSNFRQVGFPRTWSGVTPKIFGGNAGPNAMNAIYMGGTVSVGVGAAGPYYVQ